MLVLKMDVFKEEPHGLLCGTGLSMNVILFRAKVCCVIQRHINTVMSLDFFSFFKAVLLTTLFTSSYNVFVCMESLKSWKMIGSFHEYIPAVA